MSQQIDERQLQIMGYKHDRAKHELRPIQAALENTSDPAQKAAAMQVFLAYRQAKLFKVGKWQEIDDASILPEDSEANLESVDGDPAAPVALSQQERTYVCGFGQM